MTKKTTTKKTGATPANNTLFINGKAFAVVGKGTVQSLKNQVAKAKAALAAAEAAAAEAGVIDSLRPEGAPTTIPGTTGSTFSVFASTEVGTAGVRAIPTEYTNGYRVRVVPNSTEFEMPAPFTRKSGGHWSAVVKGEVELAKAIADATLALVQ